MKKLIVLLTLVLALLTQAQVQVTVFPEMDTIYVLKNEWVQLNFGVESVNKILMVRSDFYIGDNTGLNVWSQNNQNYTWYSYGYNPYHVTAMLDQSLNANNSLPMIWAVGKNKVTSISGISFQGTVVDTTLNQMVFNKILFLKSHDGILGDVNFDGFVDQQDVYILVDYFNNNNIFNFYFQRYTDKGVNVGFANILHDWPTLTSLAILNLWVNDSTQTSVQGYGIGLPFSQKPELETADYSLTTNENGIVINTKPFSFVSFIKIIDGEYKIFDGIADKNGYYEVECGELTEIVEVSVVEKPTSTTSVDDSNGPPDEFSLEQNYPNPFNPSTTINFSLLEKSYVTLKVYDILGREVETLVNEELVAGNHSVEFNASDLSSGTYFYHFITGNFSQTKKMNLIK